jgi:hypothetical protein
MSSFILPAFSHDTRNKIGKGIVVSGRNTLIKTEHNWRAAIADEPIDAKVDGKKMFCVRVENAGPNSLMMVGFTPMETFDSSEWASFGIRGFTGAGMNLYTGNLRYPVTKNHTIIDIQIANKTKEIIVILTISNNGKKKEIRFLCEGNETKSTDVSEYLQGDLLFPAICLGNENQQVTTIPLDQIKTRIKEHQQHQQQQQQQNEDNNQGGGALSKKMSAPPFSKNKPNKIGDTINVSGKHTLIKADSFCDYAAIADEPIDAKVDGKKLFCVRVDKVGSDSNIQVGFTPLETFDSSKNASFGYNGFNGAGLCLCTGSLYYPVYKYHNIIDLNISQKTKEIIVILTISDSGRKKEIRFLCDGKETKSSDVSEHLNGDRLFPAICLRNENQQVTTIPIDQIKTRTPEIERLIVEDQQQQNNKNNNQSGGAAASSSSSSATIQLQKEIDEARQKIASLSSQLEQEKQKSSDLKKEVQQLKQQLLSLSSSN